MLVRVRRYLAECLLDYNKIKKFFISPAMGKFAMLQQQKSSMQYLGEGMKGNRNMQQHIEKI